MCGICGIVTPVSVQDPDGPTLIRMRDTLLHRGPDDAGLHLDRGVGLGHRRLSIVDLAHGHQPMASEDSRYQIVYNGEVYNHLILRGRLEQLGFKSRTRCDTETVLHLYEAEGDVSVRALRGMFAFGIWDRVRRSLFLARDRFGIKPLYYTRAADGTLAFASEIKALLESGVVAPELNRRVLPDFLANHAPCGDETLFMGVHRLPPGHTLTWHDGEVRVSRYWDFPVSGTVLQGTDAELVEEYLERFREAVRLRLMADVPLGMFLSGGIDSAAITAAMSSLVDAPIKTFSVAFQEREANELTYARLVAARYGTKHHEMLLSPDDFFSAVPRLIWHEDEPMAHPSSVALNFVSRLAARHVKVVLTGEGSDETLAGYNRYRMTLLNRRWGAQYERWLPARLRSVIRSGIGTLPCRSEIGRRLRRTFLFLPPDLDSLYFDNFAVFGRDWQERMLKRAVREELKGIDPYAAFHVALARVPDSMFLDRLLYADVKTYLHELLMKQDQMSMAASLESRVPFLDHSLGEFAAQLPQHLKLNGMTTKVVLRKAMTNLLPAEIISRKKMGFPVPIGRWLRGSHTSLLDEFVIGPRADARNIFSPDAVRRLVAAHRAGEGGHSERLWSLLNLEIWQRVFLDREPVEDILVPPRSASVGKA